MKVKISKCFAKDTKKITDQSILAKIRQILVATNTAKSLLELSNLTEMSGYLDVWVMLFGAQDMHIQD